MLSESGPNMKLHLLSMLTTEAALVRVVRKVRREKEDDPVADDLGDLA